MIKIYIMIIVIILENVLLSNNVNVNMTEWSM